ncbi:ANK1 [Symbiodinium sp. CCMP2592]|nr:ANK1 [Symbiodinium sp. CCMP2592]
MNAGDVVYVLYHGDPGVWHTRLLASDLGQDEWMIITPDRDIYPEVYSPANVDIHRFYHAPDGRLPRQVPAGQVYAFAPLDPRQFGDLLRLGRQEAAAELARRGGPVMAAALAGQGNPPAPVAAGGVPQGAAPVIPGGPTTWVALEDVGTHKRGDVIAVDPGPLPPGHVVLGNRALVPVGLEVMAVIKTTPDGVAAVKFEDVRILPVQFDAQGIRRREFNLAVSQLHDTVPQGGGLQLQGPSTFLNIAKMMRDQNFTPTTFHEYWVRSSEVARGDRSVYEHECLSRVIEAMLGMQVIREAHRISPSAPDYSAADIMMGWRFRRAGQGVDSGLAGYVASELKNEAAIAKEARKAKEEADLRRRNPRKTGKAGEGGGGQGQ